MNKPTTILARGTAGALTATGLVAAAVVGVQHAGADPSSAAGTSPGTSTVADHSSTAQRSPRCHARRLHVGKAPEALTADLKAARQKVRESDATGAAKRTERREAIATIRKGVLDGKYGEQVQQRAQKRAQQRAERVEKHRASLPEELRADLAALAKMQPGADRRAAAKKIREGRLGGTYGAQVQQHAEKAEKKREQRRQACQERREQRPSSETSPAQG